MPEPFAFDSGGNRININYYVSVVSNNLVEIELLVPVLWLQFAVYLVFIDPSWVSPNIIYTYIPDHDASYPVTNTVDGDTGSEFRICSGTPQATITYDMGETVTFQGY